MKKMKINRCATTTAAIAVAALMTLPLAACGDGDGAGAGADAGGDEACGDETFTLVAGHQLADGTPFDLGLEKFAELVEEKTEGQVTVEVHPNAELGTETEMFQAMQNGTIDVAVVAPGSIAEFVPEISILSMPFLVTSREQRDAIIEGPIAEELAATVEETTGTIPMSYFGGGIRHMLFTEPVTGMDDIDGRLFRVQPSAVLTDAFAATGLEPTVVAYNELYNALQQGVVVGAENEPVYILSQNFYEPAPHIFLTGHEVTIRPLVIGSQTLDRLCGDLGELVLEAGQEAAEYERGAEAEADDAALEELESFPEVTLTEADTEAMAANVVPVWERYAEEWGLEDMLAQIRDLKTD